LDELNPVGQALIALNQGDVWLLLAVKFSGTILASTVVLLLYWKSVQRGLAVAAGIACFQFFLLVYLLFR
jgi:hypothetical protein